MCSASKRLSTELDRSAAQARTGPAMPLRSLAPRSSSSNRLPSSRRVPSAMTTMFGSAMPCRRAARFGVSPTIASLLRRTRTDQVTDHDQPGRNSDTGLQWSARLERGYRRDQLQPRPYRRSASSSWACG